MIKIEINKNEHNSFNKGIKELLGWASLMGGGVKYKLADRMAERHLSVRQLAELSGLRVATISDMMIGKKGSINIAHYFILMMVLRIENLSDLIELTVPTCNDQGCLEKDLEYWNKYGEIPETTKAFSSIIKGDCVFNYEQNIEQMTPKESLNHLIPVKKQGSN